MKVSLKFVLITLVAIVVGISYAAGAPLVADPSVLLLAPAAALDVGHLDALEAALGKAFKQMDHNIGAIDCRKQVLELEQRLEAVKELRDRMQDVEQKIARKPSGDFGAGGGGGDTANAGELTDLVSNSDGLKSYLKGASPQVKITVPSRLVKAAITSPGGQNQPLVAADRRPGIVAPAQRRFTIRDLFQSMPTISNLIEYCKELVFTNNAGPQYDSSSPTPHAEGALKNESGITFELASLPVITLAHHITASRQVLSDAQQLQGYVEGRLMYGLKLEEEEEMIASAGASGELDGLINNATAFSGGATNQTALDTLAKAIVQLQLSDHNATGIILNPADWLALQLLKDTQGRYLLGNPAEMTEARLWGLPVVATNSMPAGSFIVLDAPMAGYIADREDAEIRISDQHADNFTKNLVTILCEERLALVIVRSAAIIYGSLSYAG
jgi:HK97 family phage major capsid protein